MELTLRFPETFPETLLSYVAGTFCNSTSKIRHCVRLVCV